MEIRDKAKDLRLSGNSLSEISKKLGISKSTSSTWLRGIELNKEARLRIKSIQSIGRQKAAKTIKDKIQNRRIEFSKTANKTLIESELSHNPQLGKLLCSLLYWGEGNKTGYRVAFTNSDPIMIGSFLRLFRMAFSVNESKFRALIHLHEYHNETEIKNYWSKITNIPLTQFTKSYLKPHTSKTFRKGYKGTLRISYSNTKIVDELKAVYNELSKFLGM